MTGSNVPSDFSANDTWPNKLVVQNQLECGSCWAFSAVEAFSDCLKITGSATNNMFTLPPELMLNCDNGDDGCDGGVV